MQFKMQLPAIIISLILLTVVLFLVYKRKLREEYSLIWLLGASTLLGFSIFGKALTQVAKLLGVNYAPSLLFALSALFVVTIVLSQAVAITTLVRRNRDLAQKIAILEWHLDQLHADMKVIAHKDRD